MFSRKVITFLKTWLPVLSHVRTNFLKTLKGITWRLKVITFQGIKINPTYLPIVWNLFPTTLVTKVIPNINSVEVHPQLSNNRHPVDGVLVGAGSLHYDPFTQCPWPHHTHSSHDFHGYCVVLCEHEVWAFPCTRAS
jgi:hypothetical protein